MLSPKLLEVLVCPLCKGPLKFPRDQHELICLADRLAYPLEEGIPVMIAQKARVLTLEEWEKWHD